MSRLMRFLVAASLLWSLPTVSHAAIISCEYDRWSGGDQEVVMSWTGTKVRIDTGKKEIRIGNRKGWSKPFNYTETSKTEKFDTYIFYLKERDTEGKIEPKRFSYRIYYTGRGELIVTMHGYLPMSAKGTCG